MVDELGNADGPLVVWLHSEWGTYDEPPLDDRVRSAARVLVFHHPGWGISTGEDNFASLAELAMAYWWTLDQLGADSRATLVGHGLGAAIAAEMGTQQPDRVAHAVLAAPFGLWDDEVGGVDLFALLPKDVAPHMYADTSSDVAREQFPPPKTAHEKGVAGIRRAQTLGTASRYLYPLPDTGLSARLYRLAGIDVVLLWGSQDGITPVGMATRWQEHLPHARLVIVDDAAHMVVYETNDLSDCVVDALQRESANLAVSGGA